VKVIPHTPDARTKKVAEAAPGPPLIEQIEELAASILTTGELPRSEPPVTAIEKVVLDPNTGAEPESAKEIGAWSRPLTLKL
jgi:hypothetical protein